MHPPLIIESLQLRNFKNYSHLEITFNADIIGFYGENGIGKTNVLDAIYYICMTKSYFQSIEQFNFKHGEDELNLRSSLTKNQNPYKVDYKIVKGQKKEVEVNRVKEGKLAHFIGRFPVIMIAPNDNMILIGGSEERRKMIDGVLCQSDDLYTQSLMQYNKLLANRNALLKQLSENQGQVEVLDTIDRMIHPLAQEIFLKRKSFIEDLSVYFESLYNEISQEKENVSILYRSHLSNFDMYALLLKNRRRDIVLQRTTQGVHLDDVEILLNTYPIKKTGSQGQQKTVIVSLKMALYRLLSDRKKISPFLLLDDIFEKFDENRIQQLFKILSHSEYGQVFITDTSVERIQNVFMHSGKRFEIFKVENGKVEKEITGH